MCGLLIRRGRGAFVGGDGDQSVESAVGGVLLLLGRRRLLLSGGKAREAGKVGVRHLVDLGGSVVLRGRGFALAHRAVVPAMALGLAAGGKRGCRHGVLVKRSGWRGSVALAGRLLEAHMAVALTLGLDSLVGFRRPAAGAVVGRRAVSNVEAVNAALQAGVVHVQVASIVNLDGVELRVGHAALVAVVVHDHGRGVAARGRRRPLGEGIERFDAWKTQARLGCGGRGHGRRRVRDGRLRVQRRLLPVVAAAVGVPGATTPAVIGTGDRGAAVSTMMTGPSGRRRRGRCHGVGVGRRKGTGIRAVDEGRPKGEASGRWRVRLEGSDARWHAQTATRASVVGCIHALGARVGRGGGRGHGRGPSRAALGGGKGGRVGGAELAGGVRAVGIVAVDAAAVGLDRHSGSRVGGHDEGRRPSAVGVHAVGGAYRADGVDAGCRERLGVSTRRSAGASAGGGAGSVAGVSDSICTHLTLETGAGGGE